MNAANASKKSSLAFSLCLLALLLSPVSRAQEATGRIYGTVADSQSAVIPGVQITVTNVATQVSRKVTTGQDGGYQILSLPIGTYRLTAEHLGFRTAVVDQQKLQINQALRVDIKLEVGATTQTIDVGGESAPVETVVATLGQSVTGRTLTDMPLNGRDVLDLALLQPGVTETNDDNNGAGWSASPAADRIPLPISSTAG